MFNILEKNILPIPERIVTGDSNDSFTVPSNMYGHLSVNRVSGTVRNSSEQWLPPGTAIDSSLGVSAGSIWSIALFPIPANNFPESLKEK